MQLAHPDQRETSDILKRQKPITFGGTLITYIFDDVTEETWNFRVLLTQDTENSAVYYSRCLDMDIMEHGESMESANKIMHSEMMDRIASMKKSDTLADIKKYPSDVAYFRIYQTKILEYFKSSASEKDKEFVQKLLQELPAVEIFQHESEQIKATYNPKAIQTDSQTPL